MFYAARVTQPLVKDWSAAIARNRDALLRIVAGLFAMLGLAENMAPQRISRPRCNAILRILRPAEAAVRRLIFAAARDIAVKPWLSKPLPKDKRIAKGDGSGKRRPSFQLSDNRGVIAPQTRRKFARIGPRISHFDDWKPGPGIAPRRAPEPADGLVNAARLAGRLLAIREALDDLPRQARRLARWKARRRRQAGHRIVHVIPLRAGRAPYLPDPPRTEVEEILAECHWLAWEVRFHDTS
jgi:hypothetical protein